jgi:predicted O-methyltransferase YrrM
LVEVIVLSQYCYESIQCAKGVELTDYRRSEMAGKWTVERIMDTTSGYRGACVLFAAADLDIFSILDGAPETAQAIAAKLGADPRATVILLDALAAMELLAKEDGKYSTGAAVAELLTERSTGNVLGMVRHQANCLRRWVQLAQVIKSGKPAERQPSLLGAEADQASFIAAMHNFSGLVADQVVIESGSPQFRHLLDIGGASGTWTIAFLRAAPEDRATIFDLPEVIPMARQRIVEAGLGERVAFTEGDFYTDDLPGGADFAWLGAIAHQNSRQQNRQLFAKIYAALVEGGRIVLRDVVMDPARTRPEAGAMFAVNMLVATEGGGTYTFEEYRSDLGEAGFGDVTLLRQDEFMNSLVRAVKL